MADTKNGLSPAPFSGNGKKLYELEQKVKALQFSITLHTITLLLLALSAIGGIKGLMNFFNYIWQIVRSSN